MMRVSVCLLLLAIFEQCTSADERLPQKVTFNAHIRPIMSQTCFVCHGPDDEANDSGFRIDSFKAATSKLSDETRTGIVPGEAEDSEVYQRIMGLGDGEQMPPEDFLHQLSSYDKALIRRWIEQGAEYEQHWSYTKIERPSVPKVQLPIGNEIDAFIYDRLGRESLKPSPQADKRTLLRRLSLDLIGLPPTPEEVQRFLHDDSPDAYAREVERLLSSPHFGERMAIRWLDLVRFADTVGFHGDQNHNIYPYRDFVINSINRNQPFDEFTRDQLAGDLLPNPTPEQLAATGVLRLNMMTREGGGQPEEYLAKYTADRVRLLGTAWLGSTTGCCECHNHKFDPFTIKDFYSLGAYFDDLRQWGIYADYDYAPNDYTPNPELDGFGNHHPFPPEMRIDSASTWASLLEREAVVEDLAAAAVPEKQRTSAEMKAWAQQLKSWLQSNPEGWQAAKISKVESAGATKTTLLEDQSVLFEGDPAGAENITLELHAPTSIPIVSMRLEVLPDERHGGFVGRQADGHFELSVPKITRVAKAQRDTPATTVALPRYVRIELPHQQFLSLAEVEVLVKQADGQMVNVAPAGVARQSSTYPGGEARKAIDGITDGDMKRSNSVSHTNKESHSWWELNLAGEHAIQEVRIWNRTDGKLGSRLTGYRVILLDAERNTLWQTKPDLPTPKVSINPPDKLFRSRNQQLEIAWAIADRKRPMEYKQSRIPEYLGKRWASGPEVWQLPSDEARLKHTAVYHFERPVTLEDGDSLFVTLRSADVGRVRVSFSPFVRNVAGKPAVSERLKAEGSPAQATFAAWFLSTTPKTRYPEAFRKALRLVAQRHSGFAMTMIAQPVEEAKRRRSRVLPRGDWQSKEGEFVKPRPPEFLVSTDTKTMGDDHRQSRLDLAGWITSPDNPLTARHFVNYTWQQFFGTGLSSRLDDLGSQGEWPSHPLLLDWLASEFINSGWDRKHIVRLMVLSNTYQQAAAIRDDLKVVDPYNRLLAQQSARRLEAEVLRDNALEIAGLLSKRYLGGPSILPYQPRGHWRIISPPGRSYPTSPAHEQYRRGVYTHWQRTFLHPMLTNFDAPARDECVAERPLSNSPQQALTLLNDPSFVEASVAMADKLLQGVENPTLEDFLQRAFHRALLRPAREEELRHLTDFVRRQERRFQQAPERAQTFLGAVRYRPTSLTADTQLAAWSQACRAILNSHECITRY